MSQWSPYDGLFGRRLIDLKREMERKRQNEEKRQRIRAIRLNRVEVEIRSSVLSLSGEKEILHARMVGQDFNIERMRLFSNAPVEAGTLVAVTLLDNAKLYLRGKVVWCHPMPYPETKIISPRTYTYRVEIEFQFENWLEKQNVQDYVRQFQSRYVLGA